LRQVPRHLSRGRRVGPRPPNRAGARQRDPQRLCSGRAVGSRPPRAGWCSAISSIAPKRCGAATGDRAISRSAISRTASGGPRGAFCYTTPQGERYGGRSFELSLSQQQPQPDAPRDSIERRTRISLVRTSVTAAWLRRIRKRHIPRTMRVGVCPRVPDELVTRLYPRTGPAERFCAAGGG